MAFPGSQNRGGKKAHYGDWFRAWSARRQATGQDPNRRVELREYAALRLIWWAFWIACICLLLLLSGCCTPHTVYVPAGKAVRLRQSITADVWVLDAEGNPVAGRMTIPEGWFCLPDPEEGRDGTH